MLRFPPDSYEEIMLFGYAREVLDTQNISIQVNALLEYGVPQKNIYTDTKPKQKNLGKLLSSLDSGDILVIWKLDRLAKSVQHITQLINDFHDNEIDLISIEEPFLDTTSAYGSFIFNLFNSLGAIEKNIFKEKTRRWQKSAEQKKNKILLKKKLSKKERKQARLAVSYYKDQTKQFSVEEILKLTEIESEERLNYYLTLEGLRKCVNRNCNDLFWDKNQASGTASCEVHLLNNNETLCNDEKKNADA